MNLLPCGTLAASFVLTVLVLCYSDVIWDHISSSFTGLLKILKCHCCMNGRTPTWSMKPHGHHSSPLLSWSPLRLFAQAVAQKTAHSVWMFFSQARAAVYMFAFPPLSKATFTSGPKEKGSTVYESMQAWWATLLWNEVLVWYVPADEGCLGSLIYLCFCEGHLHSSQIKPWFQRFALMGLCCEW